MSQMITASSTTLPKSRLNIRPRSIAMMSESSILFPCCRVSVEDCDAYERDDDQPCYLVTKAQPPAARTARITFENERF